MAKKQLTDLNFNDFSAQLLKESDRSCAILGASLVDAKLEAALKRRLRSNKDAIFGANGALSAFSARIQLAHALAWIDDNTQHDLNTVRKIRNDFAHSFDHEITFADSSVSDRCKNLRTATAYLEGFDLAAKAGNSTLGVATINRLKSTFEPSRNRYEMTVIFLVQQLDEITTEEPIYNGTDLLAEVRELSRKSSIKISHSNAAPKP